MILCAGMSDTGKTHLVASILDELKRRGERPVHVDLDMGQSTIGPPATIGLKDPDGREYLYFVGNTSPLGITGEIRSGLALFRTVLDGLAGFRAVVDTEGLVAGPFGMFVKRMEMEGLAADLVAVIDRSGEALPIAAMAKRLGVDCCLLAPEGPVSQRSRAERAAYRERLFAVYFGKAREVTLSTAGLDLVFQGSGPSEPGRLLGLVDEAGLLVCLGLLVRQAGNAVTVLAPPFETGRVRAIRFGRYNYRG